MISKENKIKLALDAAIFAAFLAAMDPRGSGIAVHEWLSLALAGTVVVHLLLNWDWIIRRTRSVFGKGLNGARFAYILNWLLFIDGVLITLSGILISESALPALGFVPPENFAWRGLHDVSANLSLVLMGLHLALHWNWIVAGVKGLFARGEKRAAASLSGKDAQA